MQAAWLRQNRGQALRPVRRLSKDRAHDELDRLWAREMPTGVYDPRWLSCRTREGMVQALAFTLADGLSWTMGGESGRTRTEGDLTLWRAARGAAGRMPPTGFPRDNRFG